MRVTTINLVYRATKVYRYPDRINDDYPHAKYVAYAVLGLYFAGLVGMCVVVRFW